MSSLRLTTDHTASHGGVPVLVDKAGAVYGPADFIILGTVESRACDAVRHLAKHCGFDPDLVERFVSAGGPDRRLGTVFAMIGAGMGTVLD